MRRTSDDFHDDRELTAAWEALGDRLRAVLDCEAGLVDALLHDEYRRLERRLGLSLDLESGLRAAWTAGTPGPSPIIGNEPRRGGSPALRVVVGAQLRRLREAAGITREAAGEAIRTSHAKISRLEMGRAGFVERDVEDLLNLYGVSGAKERDEFLAHVRGANSRGWWQQYGGVLPTWKDAHVSLEQTAAIIRTYQVQLVPELLQDSEYARNVLRARSTHESEDHIDWQVQLLMARQKMLTEPGAPQFWAVVDESVISLPHGPRHVMTAQLERLLEMSELPNVTVQVLPFRFGSHTGDQEGFTILRFAEWDLPDIVYLEQLDSAFYLDTCSEVEEYQSVMEVMCVLAVTPRDSRDRLRKALREL